MRNENQLSDLEIYQQARIEALEKLVEMQDNLIGAYTERIDELTYDVAKAKADLNIMVRNIEVIDAEFEKPLK